MSQGVTATYDVLGMGIVTVDDFLYVDTYPPADSKTRVVGRQRRTGGLTGNALRAAALLGARCGFAGALGDDELSQFIRAEFQRTGIDTSLVDPHRRSRPIHSTIVVDESTASRTIFFELPINLEFGGDWPPEAVVRSARVLFIDHYDSERTIRAARLARGAGIPVVADFERSDGPDFRTLLALPDHLILGEQFASGLAGSHVPDHWFNALDFRSRAVVVVTCGARGGWYRRPDDPAPVSFPAHSVTAKDTTACGDVFHGAYAAELARGGSVDGAVAFANAAAALKATGRGLDDTLVNRAHVRAFMNRRSSATGR